MHTDTTSLYLRGVYLITRAYFFSLKSLPCFFSKIGQFRNAIRECQTVSLGFIVEL